MIKRILSMALVLCMCLSLMPASALAAEEQTATVTLKVVYGKWHDDTTADIKISVPLHEGKGQLKGSNFNRGMKPVAGYRNGTWDPKPVTNDGKVTISGDITYTYTFVPDVTPAFPSRKSIMGRVNDLRNPWPEQGDGIVTVDFYSGTHYNPSDYIYFGNYEQNGNTADGKEPIKWRVLNVNSNKNGYVEDVFLLSEYILDTEHYHEQDSCYWLESKARKWCKDFGGETTNNISPAGLSSSELNAIEAKYGLADVETNGIEPMDNGLYADKVFIPSLTDVQTYLSTYEGSDHIKARFYNSNNTSEWTTRTAAPHTVGFYDIQSVTHHGGLVALPGQGEYGIRPCLYLDIKHRNYGNFFKDRPVIMMTAAQGGKSAIVVGEDMKALQDLPNYDGNEWKLTVVDDDRKDFNVSVNADKIITYSNARTGAGEYLSAILVENGTDKLTHYGRLVKLDTSDKASGKITIDTQGLTLKGHTLYVFNEQCNGDYQTDYASPLQEVRLLPEKDYLLTAQATVGQISSGVLKPETNIVQPTGEWNTSIQVKENTWILVNPESGPEGTMLTGVKAVTNSGHELKDWIRVVYQKDNGSSMYARCLRGMPNEDVTIIPIFDQVIDRVDVGMSAHPLVGQTPNDIALTVGEGATYTAGVQWEKTGGAVLKPDEAFAPDQDYIAYITLNSKAGYAFRGDTFGDPIPEELKTKVFYEGTAAAETNRSQAMPNEPVFQYSGNLHEMYLQVKFSNLPTAYEVHFDANGMEGAVPKTLSHVGSERFKAFTIPETPIPTKENFDFIGWNIQADGKGTTFVPGEKITLFPDTHIVTLYASCAAHTHEVVPVPGQAADSCKTDGWKDYYQCTTCGKFFEDQACAKEIPDLDAWKAGDGKIAKQPHTWDEGKVTQSAKCDQVGEKTFTCTVCKATKTEEIPAIGHEWGAPIITFSADGKSATALVTCTKDTNHTIDFKNVEVSSKITTPATCSVKGTTAYTATVEFEGSTYTSTKSVQDVAINPANHSNLKKVNEKPATCTENGTKAYWYCSACNKNFADPAGTQEIADLAVWKAGDGKITKLPHTWNKGEVTKPATCTQTGEKTFTCTVCQAKKTETIAKISHSYGTVWMHNNINHWKECSVCNTKGEIAAHTYGAWTVVKEATETEAGQKTHTCSVCGYVETQDIPAKGHTHSMVHHAKVPATCTENGTKEYWHCTACNKNFADATGKTEITDLTIAAAGHSWGTTTYEWSQDGKTCKATRVCQNDDKFKETVNATVSSNITKQPTETEMGQTTYTATFNVNWAALKTKVLTDIPAKGHTHSMVYHAKVPATCTKNGTKEYWHCTGCNKNFADATGKTEITDLTIAATGHNWDTTTYEWSQDGKTCKATRVCQNDDKFKETVNATVTSKITKQPTETEMGQTTYTATFNVNWATQQTKDLTDVPVKEHTHIGTQVTGQAPTCANDGWKDYYKCQCGKFFEDKACTTEITDLTAWKNGAGKLEKTGHTFGDWKQDDSEHWKECTSCHTIVEKAAHTYSDWTVVKAATEAEEGLEKRNCAVCGHEETRIIPTASHTHSAVLVTGKAPTCTADGWKDYYKCQCGKFFEDEAGTTEITDLAAWKNGAGKLEKTGHTSGDWKQDDSEHWKECTSCHAIVEKAAHTYSDWTVVKAATETEEGLEKRNCSVCGHEETRVIPKLEHTHAFGDNWIHDDSNHWHECSCGAKSDITAHTMQEIIDKAPTETETGLKHSECAICGYKTKDVVIPALNHKHVFDSTWMKDDTDHWHECSCGEKADVTAHSYEWIIDKEATETTDGAKHQHCTVCGYNAASVTIPATKVPQDKPADTVEKVEAKPLNTVPEGLKDTEFNTIEKIQQAMEKVVLTKIGEQNTGNAHKTIVYDAVLMITENGVTRPATKEEVEARGGITVMIPYPAGTNKADFVFTVAHMLTMDMAGMKAGDIETPEITLTDTGLQVTLKGLSPIMIGYSKKAAEPTPAEPTVPETTAPTTPATTEPTKPNPSTGVDIPQTGDESNILLWSLLGFVSAFGMIGTALFKKKKTTVK